MTGDAGDSLPGAASDGAAVAIALPPAPWAAVLAISAAFALNGSRWAVLAWGALCIAFALAQWKAGVFLWVATAATMMTPVYTHRNSVVLLSTALLAALLALRLARAVVAGTLPLPRSKLTVPLLAVAVTAVLSGAQGALLYDPHVTGAHRFVLVQLYAVALVVLSVAAAFLVAEAASTSADVAWVVRIVVGIGVLFIAVIVLPYDDVIPMPRWSPLVLAHSLAFVYARLLFGPPLAWVGRLGGAVLIGVIVWQVVLRQFIYFTHAQWLSGWLMLGPAIAILTLLRVPRLALAVSVPAGAMFAYLQLPAIIRVYEMAAREGDFGRLYIWQDALSMALMRPLLGIGPGNYLDYAERYARVDMFFGSAHGDYQQIAAEMGLVGLFFVVWLFARALGVGWRTFRLAAQPLQRTVAAAALAILGGQLCAAVVGDYLLPAYHNGGHTNFSVTVYNWVLLGVLMAIERTNGARVVAPASLPAPAA